MNDQTPAGFHYEWAIDERWLPTDGRKCSRAGCVTPAIMLLERNHRRFMAGVARWGYCAEHLYGLGSIRKIENGVVMLRRLVKDEGAA